MKGSLVKTLSVLHCFVLMGMRKRFLGKEKRPGRFVSNWPNIFDFAGVMEGIEPTTS